MRLAYIFSLLLLTLIVKAGAPATAADKQLPSSKGNVEVTADESLEWYQERGLYVARKGARAVRGDLTIEADILMAEEKPKGKEGHTGTNLSFLTAEGHVHIRQKERQIFGDHALYDLDRKTARVTGKNIRYETDKDIVTARDSLEYYEDQNVAVARGNAVAVRDKRRVEADLLTAYFTKSSTGSTEMTHMNADGHVTVVTNKDVARGDKARYNVQSNKAILQGQVRITRADGTHLEGNRAEIDFNKGESRLLNQGQERVRILLVPKTAPKASTN